MKLSLDAVCRELGNLFNRREADGNPWELLCPFQDNEFLNYNSGSRSGMEEMHLKEIPEAEFIDLGIDDDYGGWA